MNNNEEFTMKSISKLALELNLDFEQQRIARDCIYYTLHNYNVFEIQTALVATDVQEKIMLYLQMKQLAGYSKSTLTNYMYTLRKFASSVTKPVNCITKNDIRFFLMNYCKGKKASTQNSITFYIKGFFTWLEQEELIERNPARKLDLNKVPKRLRKSLTVEELERLRLGCSDYRERALIEFLFASGCRVSEVVNTNIEDIDFSKNMLRVVGKGDKERIIFINDKCKLHLKNYINTRQDSTPALFIRKGYPYSRLGKRGLEDIVKKIANNAKFEKSVYPHLLRHTMATLSIRSGAKITTIQSILGHTSPATTQIYAQDSIDNLQHEYNQHVLQ